MAVVRIPPTLRNEVGGERAVEAAGGTVRELLDDLMERFPGLRGQLVEDGDVAPFVSGRSVGGMRIVFMRAWASPGRTRRSRRTR